MTRAARAVRFRLAATLAVTTCLTSIALPGLAQETSEGDDATATLDKVIVTTRFKEETVQDIPASVTALNSEIIERAGVRNIEDVARLTPGLNYVSLGSNFALPVIRGLSTNVGESNVGMFVDGVYQGSRSGMDRPLADVERVEVIKGPQIALYGRNAFGGAINVITRAPSNEPSFNASATIGENGRLEGSAYVSGPIAKDTLFGRFGVSYAEHDGFYTNTLTGEDLDPYEATYYSGALLWQVTPTLSFDLRGNYEDSSRGDRPGYFILNNDPVIYNGRSQIYLGEVPAQTDGFAVTPGGYDRESMLWSLTGKWEISDRMELSSITSYSDLDGVLRADIDYSAADLNYQTQQVEQEWFSQEFRLSVSGDSFDWLAGLYYSDQEQTDDNLQLVTNEAIENALPGSLRSSQLLNTETSEVSAIFGSVTWRFAPNWSMDLAGRFFREEKNLDPYQSNPYTGVVLTPNPDLAIEDEFFTPSLAVSWDASDNVTFYGSVARGVKSGGFNALANVTDAERLYDAEKSWNYELGMKSSWHEDRLTLNAALFHIDWSDQIVRALGELGATLNANAGATTSQGFEIEMMARPVEGLDLSLGYTYTDASFDEYTFPALERSFGLDPVLDGHTLQYVPEHMIMFGSQYQAHLVGDWDWFARFDASYRSKQYGSTTNLFWVGDQTNANLAFGLDSEHWSAELWVRNLFDEDTPTVSIQQRNLGSVVLPPAGQGVFRVLSFAPEPQNAGITLRYRY